jgi:hypothetical protein
MPPHRGANPHKRPRTTAPTRQVVAAALTLLALGGIGTVQAALAGASFMTDLEVVTPALARVDPVIDPAPTPRIARRVFLVIIDGLRYDKSYELPFLDELRRRGVDADATSHYPTWSRPNYVSILAGVPPIASGVRTNHHHTPVMLDTLMDRCHAAGLRVSYASDSAMMPALFLRKQTEREPVRIAEGDGDEIEDVDIDAMEPPMANEAVHTPDANLVSPFDDSRYAPWPGGFAESSIALVKGDADLVILLVGAVDSAGHSHGARSDEYRQAAEMSDHALARALAGIDLSLDTIIVTADHGHTGRGGHGGMEPEVLQVPLILAGAGVVPASYPHDARLIDIAPTVATLLGIAAPGHGLGRTLTEVLQLDPQARTQRIVADEMRVVKTRAVVGAAEAKAEVKVLEHRALRIGIVIGGAVLACVLAFLLVRRHVMHLDVRVLVVSVPAFFIVYYALIGLLGERFSPSLVPAEGHMAGTLVKYGIAGGIVQLVASLLALRKRATLADRLAGANGIAWTGLMVTMVVAGLLWAFFPPPYVTVPGPFWLVMIPAGQVAVACVAVNVALTLTVEVIVFVARAYGEKSTPGSGASLLK